MKKNQTLTDEQANRIYESKKFIQIIPVPQKIYAVFKNKDNDGPEEIKSPVLFAALTADGDISLIDFASDGYFDVPTEAGNFLRFELVEDINSKRKNNMDNLDWKAAEDHFNQVKKVYEDMEGMPGVNTSLALNFVFSPLQVRFDSGERSPELHEEMMNVE